MASSQRCSRQAFVIRQPKGSARLQQHRDFNRHVWNRFDTNIKRSWNGLRSKDRGARRSNILFITGRPSRDFVVYYCLDAFPRTFFPSKPPCTGHANSTIIPAKRERITVRRASREPDEEDGLEVHRIRWRKSLPQVRLCQALITINYLSRSSSESP